MARKKEQALLDELAPLVGVERSLHDFHYTLKVAVRSVPSAVVGALHVSCSDEARFESAESFQTSFAGDALPRLKFAHRSPFVTANLGGRFEWDSLRIAEDHFSCAAPPGQPVLMVVKISSHVALEPPRKGLPIGTLERFGTPSACCGALAAVVAGAHRPRVEGLAELLRSEGVDRLELLRREVDPEVRPLAAALVAARLQARSATLEAQDLTPTRPALFLILPTVTLNRSTSDTEILCGLYLVDRRRPGAAAFYQGLGDRPERYSFDRAHDKVRVRDDEVFVRRRARDHRHLVREARRASAGAALARDQRVDRALAGARQSASLEPQLLRTLLKTALVALAEVSPVPAALLLFSEGAGGIYHAYRAHQLVADVAADGEARQLLADLHQQVDQLPEDQVRKVLRVLASEYEGGGRNPLAGDPPPPPPPRRP